jgi:cysteate synthase
VRNIAEAEVAQRRTPTAYVLRCCGCGSTFEDDGVRLDCPADHPPALLRSVFSERRLTTGPERSVLRYGNWLPLRREVRTDLRTAVYHSEGLGPAIGLRNLWIAFNGWWPERGSTLTTATFKELEAVSVLARMGHGQHRTLVVASAGNTAAAFAQACTENDVPLVIVIPLWAWGDMASIADLGPSVKTIAIADGGYDDAIAFARRIADHADFVYEGGVRNIARRDGLGTVLLEALAAIGSIPQYYFQAVGSAAGALGIHEAGRRLIADGRFGSRGPRLMLSQNAPFTPIHDAWSARSTLLFEKSDDDARRQLEEIGASVLSNLAPPYAQPGGVREALTESNGMTFAVTNAEMARGSALFIRHEGIDIDPAAGVATASLIDAIAAGEVGPDDTVLLNVSGGGRKQRLREVAKTRPTWVIERARLDGEAERKVRSLFA